MLANAKTRSLFRATSSPLCRTRKRLRNTLVLSPPPPRAGARARSSRRMSPLPGRRSFLPIYMYIPPTYIKWRMLVGPLRRPRCKRPLLHLKSSPMGSCRVCHSLRTNYNAFNYQPIYTYLCIYINTHVHLYTTIYVLVSGGPRERTFAHAPLIKRSTHRATDRNSSSSTLVIECFSFTITDHHFPRLYTPQMQSVSIDSRV